jgi:cytochrome c551/c552
LPPVLLAALSSAQKAGLAGMAAAFIIFALVSSFVIPRRWPDFPGRFLWAYVGVVAGFFAAMILVVVFVAREQTEAKAESTTTTSTSTSAAPPPTAPPAPAPTGNAVAGKALFAANGCAACHTFKPANATGTVGPNLDNLAANAKTANRGSLDQYTTESIVDPNAYIVPGFSAGVMPPDFGTKLSKTQVADLVAFLTQ